MLIYIYIYKFINFLLNLFTELCKTSDIEKPIQNNSNTVARGVLSRKANLDKNICNE